MKRALTFSLICGLSLLVGNASAQQPNRKPTDVEIEAHVYEPVQLEVSEDLIGQLQLPDGFKNSKVR